MRRWIWWSWIFPVYAFALDPTLSVDGAYLYWSPFNLAFETAVRELPDPVGSRREEIIFSPGYSSGYRVGIEVEGLQLPIGILSGEASYTFFRSSKQGKTQTGSLEIDFVPITAIRPTYQLRYQTLDIDLKIFRHCWRCGELRLFGGGRLVDLWEKRQLDFIDATLLSPVREEQRNKILGGGARIGLYGQQRACALFNLEGELAVGGVVGSLKTLSELNAVEGVFALQRRETILIPCIDLFLALSVAKDYGCLGFKGYLGYEWNTYYYPFRYFSPNLATFSFVEDSRHNQLTVAGLVAGLALTF